ncbi:hypothetical protein [Neisseria dumasiana]|uniref:Uncharacterized protein n=1 Tax=Neisseria dumasiana TaxID=1931275 RepID=A0ABX3WHS0_9NEIS|nr:hypothetical protein [Neisseria dumasiana]OSI24334.1 hypothetical protein BV913_12420 [Neisseria dumasiana]UOO84348.1 hypothetical protein LVJ88_11970 [Neisseria dumasiana]
MKKSKYLDYHAFLSISVLFCSFLFSLHPPSGSNIPADFGEKLMAFGFALAVVIRFAPLLMKGKLREWFCWTDVFYSENVNLIKIRNIREYVKELKKTEIHFRLFSYLYRYLGLFVVLSICRELTENTTHSYAILPTVTAVLFYIGSIGLTLCLILMAIHYNRS